MNRRRALCPGNPITSLFAQQELAEAEAADAADQAAEEAAAAAVHEVADPSQSRAKSFLLTPGDQVRATTLHQDCISCAS